jgi:eukaryotic-like serine/threonine-protein kinase
MGMLDGFKVNRAIEALVSAPDAPEADKRQALATLRQLADRAVPRLFEALADPASADAIAGLLRKLLDNSTLPLFVAGVSHADTRIAARVLELLCGGGSFDPNRLLDLFQNPDAPKARLVEILSRHKQALNPQALFRLLDAVDKEHRTLILRLVEEAATDAMIPELTRRTGSEDWLTRLYLARTLRRFNTDAARDALTALLADSHKTVRLAALEGLAGMQIPVDIAAVCGRLRDPDLTVQAKAIETIVQINDPASVHHLLDILQDESEYVRRAAVEVLNQVGNTSAIKDLLGALRDRDWWVRVRAADALGTIGGPKVIEAVLSLVKDKDEFIRRCAVEILITTRVKTGGEAIFTSLVDALNDGDWWVRERAIDALAGLGDPRAVPPLIRVMEQDVKAAPIAIRALAALGDPHAIGPLLAQLRRPDKAVKAEAIRALVTLTDEAHAEAAQRALLEQLQGLSGELRDLADRSLRTMTSRFGSRASGADVAPTEVRTPAPMAQSLLYAPEASAKHASLIAESGGIDPTRVIGRGAAEPLVDAAALPPGMVLADRYRVVRHIGSGAFGVVILVEDVVVHEEIILKFLKPHVASDEQVIKRFVQELRYARRITHENVIRIHDFIAVGRSYAISMEYFPGFSLAALLARGGPLPIPRAFAILQGICHGMSVAHRAGIIHRDLKPANVLLNESDLVKVVDFGLAAASSWGDPALTRTGLIVGTPAYIAPEQAQGGKVDPRTDIYSLGVIMYEMLCGRPPYTGPDPVSILLQHVQGKVTPPRQVNPALPPGLETTILKAMALAPAERHQSMEELERALERLIESEGS